MRPTVLLLLILMLLPVAARAATAQGNASLIDSLADEKERFVARRQSRSLFIDSVKMRRKELAPSLERTAITRSLGDIYFRQEIDSALTYWNLAISEAAALGLEDEVLSMRMRYISALPRTGVAVEAIEEYSAIDPATLHGSHRREYWRYAAELYYYVQQPYPAGKYKTHYIGKTVEALDSLQRYYAVGSPIRRYMAAQTHLLNNEVNLAVADFIEILPGLRSRPEFYQFALWTIANFYKDRKDYRNLYVNYMLRLCIESLRLGRPMPIVLAQTGSVLVEEGERRLGNALIEEALSTSDLPRGPYQSFDRSVYTHHLSSDSRSTIFLLSVVIFLLVAGVVMCVLALRRRRERINAAEQRLKIAAERHALLLDEMKKVNASVLSLAFLSTGQLRDYNLYVMRKLKTGQANDLAKEVESGSYMQVMVEKFYTSFDDIFLTNFPNFLDKLNELLVPERRLSLLPDNRMTPELRIAAMVRMGVTESARLSQALGLSINTIYTYRNRLKGRAVDRHNFDKNLSNLPFVS